jgi:hypothetical protein
MARFKSLLLLAMLLSPAAASAQGTQQSGTAPNGVYGGRYGSGGFGSAEPIGRSGAPVATGQFRMGPNGPIATPRVTVVRPRRRR